MRRRNETATLGVGDFHWIPDPEEEREREFHTVECVRCGETLARCVCTDQQILEHERNTEERE